MSPTFGRIPANSQLTDESQISTGRICDLGSQGRGFKPRFVSLSASFDVCGVMGANLVAAAFEFG